MDLVDNICVHASAERSKPIAIVSTSGTSLKRLATDNGVKELEVQSLIGNRKIRDIALQNMQDVGRKNGLSNIEIIDGLVLVEDQWTPQSVSQYIYSKFCIRLLTAAQGLTSPAQKLNRRAILQKYKTEVNKVYSDQVRN